MAQRKRKSREENMLLQWGSTMAKRRWRLTPKPERDLAMRKVRIHRTIKLRKRLTAPDYRLAIKSGITVPVRSCPAT